MNHQFALKPQKKQQLQGQKCQRVCDSRRLPAIFTRIGIYKQYENGKKNFAFIYLFLLQEHSCYFKKNPAGIRSKCCKCKDLMHKMPNILLSVAVNALGLF